MTLKKITHTIASLSLPTTYLTIASTFWIYASHIILFDFVPFYGVYSKLIFLSFFTALFIILIKHKRKIPIKNIKTFVNNIMVTYQDLKKISHIKKSIKEYDRQHSLFLSRKKWHVVINFSMEDIFFNEPIFKSEDIEIFLQENQVYLLSKEVNIATKIMGYSRFNKRKNIYCLASSDLLIKNEITSEKLNAALKGYKKNTTVYLLIYNNQSILGLNHYCSLIDEDKLSPLNIVFNIKNMDSLLEKINHKIYHFLRKHPQNKMVHSLFYLPTSLLKLQSALLRLKPTLRLLTDYHLYLINNPCEKLNLPPPTNLSQEYQFEMNTEEGVGYSMKPAIFDPTLFPDIDAEKKKDKMPINHKKIASFLFLMFSIFILFAYQVTQKHFDKAHTLIQDYSQKRYFLEKNGDISTTLPLLYLAYKIKNELYVSYLPKRRMSQFIDFNTYKIFIPSLLLSIKKQLTEKNHYHFLSYAAMKSYVFMKEKSPLASKAIETFILNDVSHGDKNTIHYFSKKLSGAIFEIPPIKNDQTFFSDMETGELLVYELNSNLYKKITLNNKIKNFCDLFDCKNEKAPIPYLFTTQGYHHLIRHELIKFQKNIAYLSKKEHLFSSAAPSHKNIFLKKYDDEYNQAWDDFLSGLKIKKFSSLKEISFALKLLQKNKNPVFDVLNIVKDNSYPLKGEREAVFNHFLPLNTFPGMPGMPSENKVLFEKDIKEIYLYLATITQAPNPLKRAFEETKVIFSDNPSENKLLNFVEHTQKMPPIIQTWAKDLADNILELLLKDSMKYIDSRWQEEVYPYYQSDVKDHSPFSDDSASISENFNLFFSSDGLFKKFIENYLQPFINTTHQPWVKKIFFQKSIPLSQTALSSLNEIDTFIKIFINDAPAQQQAIAITPRYLDSHFKNILVSFGDDHAHYQHGPQSVWRFHWPSNNKQVKIDALDFNGTTQHITYDGPQALLKLLTESTCKDHQHHLLCELSLEKGKFIYELSLNEHIHSTTTTLNLPASLYAKE